MIQAEGLTKLGLIRQYYRANQIVQSCVVISWWLLALWG